MTPGLAAGGFQCPSPVRCGACRPSRGRAGRWRGRCRGCSAGTTARAAAARGTTVPAVRLPSWGAEGRGMAASWPSEGADPGEAQPGESFIVAPSPCLSAHRGGRLAAIVPRAVRCGPGAVSRFVPSFVGRLTGQTGRMADQYVQTPVDSEPPALPALRWDEPPEGPVLVLLDQTRLPAEEVELVCTDVPALVEAIRTLAVRGAPLLGIAGGVRGRARRRARATTWRRPPGAGAGAAHRGEPRRTGCAGRPRRTGRRRQGGGPGAGGRGGARPRRGRCTGRTPRPARGWPSTGWRCWTSCCRAAGYRLLTHCNTGALVSGGEGTAFAVALAAHRAGRLRRLWVDETRPLLQGARLTAYEAARNGMAYTLLTDNAAGSLFAAGEVDAVLIGADRIAADGSVANKVGSYPLAVLARYHHVPFIVVAPTTTVDLDTPDGASIEVEQRAGHEVTEVTSPGAGGGGRRGRDAGGTPGDPGVQPGVRRDAARVGHGDRHRGGRRFARSRGSDWQSCVPGHRQVTIS